ncbi:hypothetical protein [Metallosphaera sp.]|uniref:hypothetical protein n=1 Tax=Metallosphaera sp. TaxID=2020860 RepID=UPI0031736BDB
MKKLVISNDRMEEIIEEIRRTDDSKYDHRLHGMLLVTNGMSPYNTSPVTGNNPKSTEDWINTFLRKGFEGIGEPGRSGRSYVIAGQNLCKMTILS